LAWHRAKKVVNEADSNIAAATIFCFRYEEEEERGADEMIVWRSQKEKPDTAARLLEEPRVRSMFSLSDVRLKCFLREKKKRRREKVRINRLAGPVD